MATHMEPLKVKAGDIIKIRVTAAAEAFSYRLEHDMLLMREDGAMRVAKAGTVITLSAPVAPFETTTTIE